MEKLNFPNYNVIIKNKENKSYIFDRVRKKWLMCTKEEWVRVHCVNFLIETKGYPASWILIEKEIKVYETKKRFDIVVSSLRGENHILIECKAPSISITQETFDQIARYNLTANASYLMVTNGLAHYFCQIDAENETYVFLKDIPEY